MKKNWTLRAGVLMLALTLITSCFVGSTFAKYTTADNGTDTARVAKFGVNVDAAGTTFAKEYATTDGAYAGDVTVQSDVNVVAPGTGGDMTVIEISGTSEVAVRVTYEATVDLGNNWIDPDNGYYCPLEITIGADTLKGTDYDSADAFEAAIKEKIDGYTKDYDPGTDLSAANTTDALDVSWAWAFDGNDDVKDTYLGDRAAGSVDNAGTISLTVNATVTQID